MIIDILGSGPDKPIMGHGKNKRLQSCALIDNQLLLNATPNIEKQLDGLKCDIQAVLVSHAHHDCIAGLTKVHNYSSLPKVPVYTLPHTIKLIREKIKDTSHLDFRKVKPLKQIKILDYNVLPIPVEHSVIYPKFDPTLAWRINDVLYAEDVDQDFFESDKAAVLLDHLKNTKLKFLDGAICKGKLRGHLNIWDAIKVLRKHKIKNVFFTQIGRGCPDHEELKRLIKKYDQSFSVAYDDMRVDLADFKFHLSENRSGIYLVPHHAHMIWTGNKTLIVKKKKFESAVGKPFYLVGGNNCYGIIKIKSIEPIDLKEFEKLYPKHRVTPEERKKWWPNAKMLFAYEFDVLERFSEPKPVKLEQGVQTFITNVSFLNQTENLIKDVQTYDPTKVPTDVLKDDFRIALAWYASKKKGKNIKHSFEEILNLIKIIANELKKRGIQFHPEKMTPEAREGFERATQELAELSHSPGFIDKLNNAIIIKDFISLVGSTVEKGKGHDIDLLIRSKDLPDFIRRAIMTRISKMIPELEDQLHFIFGDPEGPHDKFIPLYDLALIRVRKTEPIEMTLAEFGLMKPFLPMKPEKRFYKPEEAAEYAFSKASRWIIEKKYDGFRAVIHRKGDQVKIFSDQGKDITEAFPTAVEQAKKLTSSDFIIDCELVPYKGNVPLGRSAAAKFIGAIKSGKKLDDSHVKFYVFDLLYLDGPLIDQPLYERIRKLRKLRFQDNIKKAEGLAVDTKKEAIKAINLMKKLPGSEGAMLKNYDGKYHPNKKAPDWIKFRKEIELKLKVLKVNPVKGSTTTFNYTVGIPVPKDANVIEDYVQDGILVLGNTFNTRIKANPGDVLLVHVEEIWRHEKNGKIRYSIHKPNVKAKIEGPPSSLATLDKYVVSRGVATKLEEKADLVQEGRERDVRDFPERMQENFREVIEKGKPMRYVMQWHYRGHRITDKERKELGIPEKYQYKLDSLHCDLRFETHKDYLEGITILSPTSTDPNVPNLIGPNMKHVRAVLKVIQPKGWLEHEEVSPISAIGATKSAPAAMVIVGKGKYMPLEVDDHKIVMRFYPEDGKVNQKVFESAEKQGILITRKIKDYLKLPRCTSFHIAHIAPQRWILLVDSVSCEKYEKRAKEIESGNDWSA